MSGKRKLQDFQKIDPHLRTHRYFRRFVRLTGMNENLAHGTLAGVWALAYDQARDGDLSRFTPEDIGDILCWEGDHEKIWSALCESGFVVGGVLHDWHEWGGALFEARDKEARRKYDQYHAEQEKISQEKTGECGNSKEKIPEERRVEKIKSIVSSNDDGFDDFWSKYPNKQGKDVARKKWHKLLPNDRSSALLVAVAMAAVVASGRRESQYCPGGAVFINQRRWEDWADGPPAGYESNGNGKKRIATFDEQGNQIYIEEEAHV